MVRAVLAVMRHGETESNLQRRVTGQSESPLTPRGEAQARQAGAALRGERFGTVYSSTLSRAFNTAALALEHSGAQEHLCGPGGAWLVERRRELLETNTGTLTGLSIDDPAVLVFRDIDDLPRPGGESRNDVRARVRRFFDAEVAPRLAAGENVLIVAHAGIVVAFDHIFGHAGRKAIPNAMPEFYVFEDGVLQSAPPPPAPRPPSL